MIGPGGGRCPPDLDEWATARSETWQAISPVEIAEKAPGYFRTEEGGSGLRARGLLAVATVLFAAAFARDWIDAWIDATPLPPLAVETSVEVIDRHGELLRAYTVADGRWRLAADPAAVDPLFF